jgi:hypothetical protein
MRRSLPEAETRSFLTFAQAKSSMASELDRHAGGYAQLGNETGVRMIGGIQSRLDIARDVEWQHSAGACEVGGARCRGSTRTCVALRISAESPVPEQGSPRTPRRGFKLEV